MGIEGRHNVQVEEFQNGQLGVAHSLFESQLKVTPSLFWKLPM
jgi:hypothetical protein